jgi:hypothetical protein
MAWMVGLAQALPCESRFFARNLRAQLLEALQRSGRDVRSRESGAGSHGSDNLVQYIEDDCELSTRKLNTSRSRRIVEGRGS